MLLRSVVVKLSCSCNCLGVYQKEGDLLLICFHFLPYCCYAVLFLCSTVIVTNPQPPFSPATSPAPPKKLSYQGSTEKGDCA